jgi:hypothetical protein
MANAANINGGGNGPPQDNRCYRCEWGSTPDDRRHIFVLNHVYELPFGKSRRWLNSGFISHLVGPWNLSGIWSLSTGEHFTAGLAAAVSNSAGGGGARPDRLRDGNLSGSDRSIDRWFDLSAFSTPAQFTYGNSAQGILVGPSNFNVDLGVHRNFQFSDRWKASFRWEMFNAMNHPNFATPNASIGNPTAGQISSTAAARIMQLALKLNF